MRKIDFEGHVLSQDVLDLLSARTGVPRYDTASHLLYHTAEFSVNIDRFGPEGKFFKDAGDQRISVMDQNGVDIQIIGMGDGLCGLPAEEGMPLTKTINEVKFDFIQKHPDRFLGYVDLNPHDVNAACREMERCAKEFGFVAWQTMSNFGSCYLDDDKFFPLLQTAAELGLPVYIHPDAPFEGRMTGLGQQLAGAGAGFGNDVIATLLRLLFKGVLDRLPDLVLITGHLGEGLPFTFDRIVNKCSRPAGAPAASKRPLAEYFENIYYSTSGVFSVPAFDCTKRVMGMDHIVFGSDYPFEPLEKTVAWHNSLSLTEAERTALYEGNAKRILRGI